MKTVSGVVISSKPVSLSKAAKILSKFSAADNGATPAYAYYLNRASESFNELVQLHKELRGANSERTSKRHRSGTGNEDEGPVASVQNYRKGDEVEEKYVEIPKEIKEPKKKKRKNGVDNGDELRIHEKLGNVENGMGGKKREKEAKKVKNHVIEDGASNGVLNEVKIENDVKNVVDNGVEQIIHEKSDTFENVIKGKKREKEGKKGKNHMSKDGVSNGALNEVRIENDVKNVVDDGIQQRIHEKMNTVEDGVGGKKREKEAKKVKNHVIENGGSNGALNEVQIDNDVKNEEIGRKRKKKMKNESVEENREEKKGSKKRKSEEMASGNGEVNDSAEKLQKKRKKSKE